VIREVQPSPFDRHYGLELDEATDELVRGHVPVVEHVLQPVGLVHGGVHASIAEALASVGTNVGVMPEGEIGLALIDELAAAGALDSYHLLHAARADLLRRSGSYAEAANSYQRALDLVKDQDFVREARLENGSVHLYVDRGEVAMPAILRLLDAARMQLMTVELHRPSLDDVFLRQTGRSLREAAA